MPKIVAELFQIGTVMDVEGDVSTLEVFPEYQDALHRIEDRDCIVILFWIPISRDVLKVHPRGDRSRPIRGVFSTRSPARPNNIGVTEVRLLERKGNIIKVKGLDAFKDTAIIDIKSCWRKDDGHQ